MAGVCAYFTTPAHAHFDTPAHAPPADSAPMRASGAEHAATSSARCPPLRRVCACVDRALTYARGLGCRRFPRMAGRASAHARGCSRSHSAQDRAHRAYTPGDMVSVTAAAQSGAELCCALGVSVCWA
eukprot:TRINITY_DN1295_c0_g1_i2.p2 TRINITY_DN1295_c0_g1~~TRINITY_DN1295_c0_g1_i2.p2  ORF type:complete len:128 (-),score=3.18 TRINITY_DN1295_c0_g1_i2:55-438(-)